MMLSGADGLDTMPVLRSIDGMLADAKHALSREQISGAIEELKVTYLRANAPNMTQMAYKMYGMEQEGAIVENSELLRVRNMQLKRVLHLYDRATQVGLIDPADSNANNVVGHRLMKIMDQIKNLYELIVLNQQVRVTANPSLDGGARFLQDFQKDMEDAEDLKPQQHIILRVLRELLKRGYRKHGDQGHLYEQILTPQGHATHAWRPVSQGAGGEENIATIESFVYEVCSKDVDRAMWLNLTYFRGNMAADVARTIAGCDDYELPRLVMSRYLFAFEDGVYDVESMEWHPHVDDPKPLSHMEAACNYFPVRMDYQRFEGVGHKVEFDNCMVLSPVFDWRNIETPSFDKILTNQNLDPATKDWIYAMCGRMLYRIGEKDGWQVIPYFKGKGGTGKSTICNFMSYVYGSKMGVLADNSEETFGLQGFIDKFAFIVPETSTRMNLTQMAFQSMVSGDRMSIPVKNKPAHQMVWRIHGMMAGNVFPRWSDNAGSISRRVMLVEFENHVKVSNPNLHKELEKDIGPMIVKMNAAYREMTDVYSRTDIWAALPQYFRNTRARLRQLAHPLASFINDPNEIDITDPAAFMPEEEFKTQLRAFMEKNGLTRTHPWNSDYYKTIFEEHEIRVEQGSKRWDNSRGAEVVQNWVVGAKRCEVRVAARQDAASASAAAAAAREEETNFEKSVACIQAALEAGALRIEHAERCHILAFRRAASLHAITPELLNHFGLSLQDNTYILGACAFPPP